MSHLDNGERVKEILGLLSVSVRSIQEWTKDARAAEKAEKQAKAFDLWLDCKTQEEVATEIGESQPTVSRFIQERRDAFLNTTPPTSLQHFDIWNFHTASTDAGTPSYFGKLPPQVIENLLWLYTEPGTIVFDPFAGGGTTIDVAKGMGRRVWASDLHPSTPTLPIHQHDMLMDRPEGPLN